MEHYGSEVISLKMHSYLVKQCNEKLESRHIVTLPLNTEKYIKNLMWASEKTNPARLRTYAMKLVVLSLSTVILSGLNFQVKVKNY